MFQKVILAVQYIQRLKPNSEWRVRINLVSYKCRSMGSEVSTHSPSNGHKVIVASHHDILYLSRFWGTQQKNGVGTACLLGATGVFGGDTIRTKLMYIFFPTSFVLKQPARDSLCG